MTLDLDAFSRCRVLVIGDLMIDEYIWGEADRISPEAPVPVVSVQRADRRLGGAGNVINNLVELGASVYVSGIIGRGPWGDMLLDRFKSLNIDTEGIIRVNDRPTIRKTRIIASNQQVVRIDYEKTTPIPDRFLPPVYRYIEEMIPEVDTVIVSDYGKGLIDDALMECVTTSANQHGRFAVADPKGLEFEKYVGVNLITPNKKEAGYAAGINITDENAMIRAGNRLLEMVDAEAVLITCGPEGMFLMKKDAAPYSIPARARQVYDVSGAGDTVLAVMGLSAAAGFSIEQGARLANLAGGIVVGKIGTATVSIAELREAMKFEAGE